MFPSSKNIDGSNIDLTNYYTKTEVDTIINSQGQAYIPCGSVQAFITTTAPEGYLICDGTEYLKSDYPQLANVLNTVDTTQGTTNFVGSDSNHFKVPDLRGEFLRGTGTNSHSGQGDGANVGEHQSGTQIPMLSTWSDNMAILQMKYPTGSETSNSTKHQDSWVSDGSDYSYVEITGQYRHQTIANRARFTSRPTNTSVLYCIAYQDIYLAPRYQYSTEEHVVGKWIDGKPVYEKTFLKNTGITTGLNTLTHNISNLDKIIKIEGMGKREDGYFMPIPTGSIETENIPWSVMLNGGNSIVIQFSIGENYVSPYAFTEIYIIIHYTKTTDL